MTGRYLFFLIFLVLTSQTSVHSADSGTNQVSKQSIDLVNPVSTFVWTAPNHDKRLDKTGVYIWYVPELRFPPGVYQIIGRLKALDAKVFTLQAVDHATNQRKWQQSVAPTREFSDLNFGEFTYSGDYPLRFSDYNQPGFSVASFSFILTSSHPLEVFPSDTADRLDGWIALQNTTFTIDSDEKKQGTASLKVTVTGKSPVDSAENVKTPWYDQGVIRRLAKDNVSMLSFWLRFDTPPRRFWLRIQHAGGSVSQSLSPSELGVELGKWRFIEVPVATFNAKTQLSALQQVYAVAFAPDPGVDYCVFHLDDILLE